MIARYLTAIDGTGVDARRYHRYLQRLFSGVPLDGRTLLDVGGGSGLISFYAAVKGATVVCLEPAADGSNTAMHPTFDRLQKALAGDVSVHLDSRSLQDLDAAPGSFDVLLLHNSVNHLDEDACTALPGDAAARRTFEALFARLFALARPGGDLLVSDCARRNFFGMLGVRNPFVPDIEWHLHQQPSVWAALAESAGFVDPRVRWNPMTRAGALGERLLSNHVGAFLTQSHFTLRASVPGA